MYISSYKLPGIHDPGPEELKEFFNWAKPETKYKKKL